MIDNSGKYSVITVEPNKKKKACEKCRVLFVSDLHIGSGFGTWQTETPFTFYRGGDFVFSKNLVISVGGKRHVLLEDTRLHVEDGETVVFHNGITVWER